MWVLLAHTQTCTSLQPTQNTHKHPNTHPYHTQSQTHPHPNTQPPCASKKTQKYPDTISSLSTHGPTGTNTPALIPRGLCVWLAGRGWTRTSGALTGPYWFISLFCVSCKAATVAVAVAVAVAAAAATAAAAAAAAG